MAAHTCRWVLTPNTPGTTGTYCEKPVKYKIKLDDDYRPYRKYSHFCPEHEQLAKAQEDDEGDLNQPNHKD